MKKKLFSFIFLSFIFSSLHAQFNNSQLVAKIAEQSTGNPVDTLDWSASTIDATRHLIVVGNTINTSNNTADILVTKYNTDGTEQWQNIYNNSYNHDDYATGVTTDDSKNIYVVGTTTTSSANGYDFFIRKYDSTGTVKWTKTYNGAGSSYDVCTDVKYYSGALYVTGGSTGSGTGLDYCTAKYATTNGTQAWVTTYNYANVIDIPAALTIAAGRIVVSGGSGSTLTNWDFATVKYNMSTGAQVGSAVRNSSNGLGFDLPTAIAKDQSDNIYVAGAASVTGNGYDVKIVKLDTALSTLWSVTWDNFHLNDQANSIAVDAYGFVYVTGYTNKIGGGTDYITLKYKSNGTFVWKKTYSSQDTTKSAQAKRVEIDPYGNILVTGTVYNIGNKDLLTLAYDTSGKKRWEEWYIGSGNGDDYVSAVKVDVSDYFYVTGRIWSGIAYQYITIKYQMIDYITPLDTESIPSSYAYYENKGQLIDVNDSIRNDLKFYTTTHFPKLYFDNSKLYFAFAKIDTSHSTTDTLIRVDMNYENHLSSMKLYKARNAPQGYLNYYLAHCSSGIIGVQGYQQLFLKGIYSGVDALYYGNSSGLKFNLICQDRFNPTDIKLKFSGADSVKILNDGKLMIYTKFGALKFEPPTAFQISSSGNVVTLNWSPTYSIVATNTVSFSLGSYDIDLPLIITLAKGYKPSPQGGLPFTQGNLDWCTYYGDYDDDLAFDVCTDGLETGGYTYMCGRTMSDNFPTTSGVSQTQFGGNNDGFAVRFDVNAVRKWATFYGGSNYDAIQAITYNNTLSSNALYAVGRTTSNDFPPVNSTFTGAYNDGFSNGDNDGCIIRFDQNTGQAKWATLFGGSGYDDMRSITFDGNGNIDISGNTRSTTAQNNSCLAPASSQFPLCNTISANCYYQTSNAGGQDCFYAIFNSNDNLRWSTFFGSDADDEVYEVSAYHDDDASSNSLYAAGLTNKITTTNPALTNCGVRTDGGFPFCDMSGNADYFQMNNSGQLDAPNAFVTNFNLDGTLRWSTIYNYIHDFQTIVEDNNNHIIAVAGLNTHGTPVNSCSPQTGAQFPICTPIGAFTENLGQLYIAKFSTSDNSLEWSTLYNGSNGNLSWVDISQSLVTDPYNYAPTYFDKFMDAAYDANHNLFVSGSVFEYNFETYELSGFFFQPDLDFGYPSQPTGITDGFLLGFDKNNKRSLATHFGGAYTNYYTLDYPRDFDLTSALSTYIKGGFAGPCDYGCSLLYMVGYTGRSEDDQTLFPVFNPGNGEYYFTQDNPSFDTYQWNAFITRFDLTNISIGISELQYDASEIVTAFPNPTTDYFTIQFQSNISGNVEILLSTVIGETISTRTIPFVIANEKIQFDVSGFASGVYFIIIKSENETHALKIVKQ